MDESSKVIIQKIVSELLCVIAEQAKLIEG